MSKSTNYSSFQELKDSLESIPSEKFIQKNSIEVDSFNRDSVKRVESFKARNIAKKAEQRGVSRNLKIAKQMEQLAISCPDTGITSFLSIPSIPGFSLIYSHPLSELANSRGIAQQPDSFLLTLDRSVLAGILIVLAADYALFSYQPTDSGAQKNAILRTVQKPTLVNAIRIIEDMIHSSNHFYIPRLSLILDTQLEAEGIDIRMENWLKLVSEAIYKPDTKFYDENETVKDQVNAIYKAQRKEKLEALNRVKKEESLILKAEKQLASDCKAALAIVKEMHKAQKISSKLRIALGGIYQPFQILSMAFEAKQLLITKLTDIGGIQADQLVAILTKNRGSLVAKNTPLDDFFADMETESSKAVPAKTQENKEIKVLSVEQTIPEATETTKPVLISGKYYMVENSYFQLSFLEKIRMNRALVAGTYKAI